MNISAIRFVAPSKIWGAFIRISWHLFLFSMIAMKGIGYQLNHSEEGEYGGQEKELK
jgi:hypothetical protein